MRFIFFFLQSFQWTANDPTGDSADSTVATSGGSRIKCMLLEVAHMVMITRQLEAPELHVAQPAVHLLQLWVWKHELHVAQLAVQEVQLWVWKHGPEEVQLTSRVLKIEFNSCWSCAS